MTSRQANRQANRQTSKVTSSLLELLVAAKKSLVMDKSGVYCLPPAIYAVSEACTFKFDSLTFVKKNMQLEKGLDNRHIGGHVPRHAKVCMGSPHT